jgi:hypothetical protein
MNSANQRETLSQIGRYVKMNIFLESTWTDDPILDPIFFAVKKGSTSATRQSAELWNGASGTRQSVRQSQKTVRRPVIDRLDALESFRASHLQPEDDGGQRR